jgi:hypothetical protein
MNKMGIFSFFSRLGSKPQIKDVFDPARVKVLRKALANNPPTTTRGTITTTGEVKQDYDLTVIDRFSDNEGLVFQAFAKVLEKAGNGGYELVSKDTEAAAYIKQRLAESAIVTQKPTSVLLKEILSDVIHYSNCFVFKYRDEEFSSGKPITIADKPLVPISAYARLDATATIPNRDENGNVKKYVVKQTAEGASGSKEKTVKVEDMVHFFCYRSERNNLGTPFIQPVLTDVQTLRRLEENVELLVHQHLFPLYQYIIGTEDKPAQDEEIEKLITDLENMPTSGGFVTPERHKIEVLGAEGEAIDASKYLEYFQKRVIKGLGIGETSFGSAAGASRASAETIDRGLIEKAKFYQQVVEDFFNEYIIKELLQEGGYETYDQASAVEVKLVFNEIDVDMRIKKENHAINKFNNNLITFDEFRMEVGKEVIDVTNTEEVEKLFFYMFGPAKLAEYEIQVKASAGAAASVANADQPSNQHGKKSSPKKTRDANKSVITRLKNSKLIQSLRSSLSQQLENARQDTLAMVKLTSGSPEETHIESLKLTFGVLEDYTIQTSKPYIDKAFEDGYLSAVPGKVFSARQAIEDATSRQVLDQYGKYIRKTVANLRKDVINILGQSIPSMSEKSSEISAVFDTRKFYVNSSISSGISQAFNFGFAVALKRNGHTKAINRATDEACETCKAQDGKEITLASIKPEDIPPHHGSCECYLEAVEEPNA